MAAHDEHPARRVGGFDPSGRRWVLLLLGLGGAALGAAVPLLAGLAASLAWMPFQGPLRLLGSFDMPWLTWLRPVLGLLLGLAAAAWVIHDSPVLHLTGQEIRVEQRGDTQRVIPREKVDAVFRRGSTLVIQNVAGRELFKGDVEGDKAEVREAFIALGYPWEGG